MDAREQVMLDNGCVLTIANVSSHYFGGYYHVRLHVSGVIPLLQEYFVNEEAWAEGLRVLGDGLVFSRELGKMGVPTAEMPVVAAELRSSFERTMLPYLNHPDFARRFVQGEFRKRATRKSGYGG